MGISHAIIVIFSLLAVTSCLASNAAQEHHQAHSLPYSSASPAHSPAQAPAPHHHHLHLHHPGHYHRHPQLSSPPPAKPPTSYPSPPPTAKTPPQPPVKPPTYSPPVKPPTKAPSQAPATHPPAKPPTKPAPQPPEKAPAPAPYSPMYPRKLVAVQGVVYCKSCNYTGIDTLLGASPLPGARVVLRCKNTKYLIRQTATTDKNGYFFLQAPQLITTYGARKCRVYLAHNPKNTTTACGRPTDLHGGVTGALLFLDKSAPPPPKPLPFTLFNVGPFACEPSKCYKKQH